MTTMIQFKSIFYLVNGWTKEKCQRQSQRTSEPEIFSCFIQLKKMGCEAVLREMQAEQFITSKLITSIFLPNDLKTFV